MENNITIVIPAYNPDNKLSNLVKQLITQKFKRIIIVNDGSKDDSKEIFDDLSEIKECIILNQAVNLGKGRALKTAFNYFLNHFNESIGVVTVDADGQHSVEDIIRVANKLNESRNSLVLGVRNFSVENIPFRSRFGNVLTKRVLSFACGINITDTQTGLRGIPKYFMKELMNVNGERFEYEMNMLLQTKTSNIPIDEVEIQTIYIEENKSSHFNPIVDSIKIYSVFIKYLFSSLASFGVDILLFSVFLYLFKGIFPAHYIIIATIGSRVLSSLFNYTVNRNVVFRSNTKNTLVKYYILSSIQMVISAYGVQVVYSYIGQSEVIVKIFVDTVLFMVSFFIQREWVFKKKSTNEGQVLANE